MTAKINLAPVARVSLLDGLISGPRQVDSFGSILAVRAAPFAELDRLKAGAEAIDFITYVIDGPELYAGHGRANRNIGDRISREAQADSQVYIINSLDRRFDKHVAAYLEARLIEIFDDLALPVANTIRPFGRHGLRSSPDLEQLFQHARILLEVAGFRRFEEARLSPCDRPLRIAATGNLHDVRILQPEAINIPADAAPMRLICRALKAEGRAIGSRLLVLPGAEYSYVSKSGLSQHNRSRRQAIEKMEILQPLPGVTGRARLTVGLDCKSRAIAAKILTGEHIGTDAWQTFDEGA
jgi:hypothetical protein